MQRLDNKTVLITGGGSGIGLAVARAFLSEGARIAITGRDEEKLRRAAAALPGGDRLVTIAADVADPVAVQSLVHQVVQRFGDVEILVNNAGVNIKERAVRELTPASWQQLLRTNLDGAFHCIHAVLPAMLRRQSGLIINIGSVSGKWPGPLSGAAYGASKFGLALSASAWPPKRRRTVCVSAPSIPAR